MRYNIGWVFVATIVTNTGVNLLCMVITTIRLIYKIIKMCLKKKRERKNKVVSFD